MKTLTDLSNDVCVITRSIKEHAATADTNREGFLVNTGTNRTLCSAIDTEGEVIVFAKTNGGPEILYPLNASDFVALISDLKAGVPDFTTGFARLNALADEIDEEDGGTAAFLREITGATP